MNVSQNKIKKALEIFQAQNGVMRLKEANIAGVQTRTLYAMRDKGLILNIERGLYQLVNGVEWVNPDLMVVVKLIPKARFCLVSALVFHDLTDQISHEVHIALPRTSRDPVLEYPPIKVYRFSKKRMKVEYKHIRKMV